MKTTMLFAVLVFSAIALAGLLDFSLPEAKVNQPYEADITKHISQGEEFKYYLLAGPEWGKLSEKGVFKGTPAVAHKGENRFDLQYCNDSVCGIDAAIIIVK